MKFKKFTKIIGVDISDHSVEIVIREKKKKEFQITQVVREILPDNLIVHGEVNDIRHARTFFHDFFSKYQIDFSDSFVRFGLSEQNIFTYVVDLLGTKKSIEEQIKKIVYETIPIEASNVVYVYHVINEAKGEKQVQIVATRNNFIQNWVDFWSDFNIKEIQFEAEVFGSGRAVLTHEKIPQGKGILILDIGSESTHISIFDILGLRYTYLMNLGGREMNKALASDLNISYLDARTLKNEVGINKQTKKALLPLLEKIYRGVQEGIDYFEHHINTTISRIYVIGGTSQLTGLVDYLKEKTHKNVEIFTPESLQSHVVKENGTHITQFIPAYGFTLYNDNEDFFYGLSFDKENMVKSFDIESNDNIGGIFVPENLQKQSGKKKYIVLVLIFVVGIVVIWWALAYRDKKRIERRQLLEQQRNIQH